MRKLYLCLVALIVISLTPYLCYAGYQTDSLTLTGLKSKAVVATDANGTLIEGAAPDLSAYIKKDGTTTTTASIPFAAGASFGSTGQATVDASGNVATSGSGQFVSVKIPASTTPVIVDSYDVGDTGNKDGSVAVSQSFIGNGSILTKVNFTLSVTFGHNSTATAYLYAHSGTYGTSSVPTGSPLATSDIYPYIGSKGWKTLTFATPYTLVSGTQYCIVIYVSNANYGKSYYAADGVSGNLATGTLGGSWTPDAAKDLLFYVYGIPQGKTTFSGGAQYLDINYTLPTIAPTGNDYPLISSTAGVLSFNDQAVKTTSNVNFGTLGAGAITGTSLIKSGGTSSQFLKADGSVSTLTSGTDYAVPEVVLAKTTTYAIQETDTVLTGSGTFTFTLPTAVNSKIPKTIKNIGTGVITIATTSSQTIDGVTTYVIRTTNSGVQIISDNANWLIKAVF